MNREQLKKINDLVEKIDKIDKVISTNGNLIMIEGANFGYAGGISDNELLCKDSVFIDRDIVIPFLQQYREKLKAELEQMGFQG